MAWRGYRPVVPLGLPLHPAIAPGGRDREKPDQPASARCRERYASGVWHLPPAQGLESADSTKVVRCAVFALLQPSDFRPRRPQRNNAGVVIPFLLPCL